jgi:hypothetical protein
VPCARFCRALKGDGCKGLNGELGHFSKSSGKDWVSRNGFTISFRVTLLLRALNVIIVLIREAVESKIGYLQWCNVRIRPSLIGEKRLIY